ncbi:MAG TPA: SH3 domain-containing protein [Anaerolineae bacterium]
MVNSNQIAPKWILALPLILALTSVACGLTGLLGQGSPANEHLPTRTPLPTFTPTPAGAAFVDVDLDNPPAEVSVSSESPQADPQEQAPVEVQAEAPEVEAETPAPTATPEPTPIPAPVNETVTVTILQNMNVRTGPGTNYPVAGPAPAGESSRAIGRNADASWLQVEYPLTADGTGWVYTELVQVAGNRQSVGVVQVAAPAQPVAAAPAAQQEAAPPPAPEPERYQFTPTGWHASENAAIVHFKGRIKTEGGGLVNGFSVLVNNGSWSVLAHPTGASHHYPDKGDGEWDVVIPNLGDGVGWWTLAVASYDCPNFQGGFDAQCKQYTILSEEIPIEVVYPEETIINADWICHWDCDKGLYVDGFRR